MNSTPDWATTVLPEVRKDTFKRTVTDFDKNMIQPKTKAFLVKNYLEKETFNIDAFYSASRALGPLAEWTKSIVQYAEIFEKIKPWREELEGLEKEEQVMAVEMAALTDEIASLEENLSRMTREF